MSTLVLITDFMHGRAFPIGPIIIFLSVWLFVTWTTKSVEWKMKRRKRVWNACAEYHYCQEKVMSTRQNELRTQNRYVTDWLMSLRKYNELIALLRLDPTEQAMQPQYTNILIFLLHWNRTCTQPDRFLIHRSFPGILNTRALDTNSLCLNHLWTNEKRRITNI